MVLITVALASACDPVTGSGSGTQPDPEQYLKADAATRTAVVTLIAGYPATDYQWNYNGYGNGTLTLTVPVGWEITVQCANRSTVPNSCAVVANSSARQPMEPGWSTPDPQRGLDPGQSASFVFAPTTAGAYRIASLVPGSEASGMWLELYVVPRWKSRADGFGGNFVSFKPLTGVGRCRARLQDRLCDLGEIRIGQRDAGRGQPAVDLGRGAGTHDRAGDLLPCEDPRDGDRGDSGLVFPRERAQPVPEVEVPLEARALKLGVAAPPVVLMHRVEVGELEVSVSRPICMGL